MAKKSGHPIREGVVIAVISALILYLATFIPGLFNWVWNTGKAACLFLVATSATAHWLLILLALLAVPTVWKLCLLCLPSKAGSIREKPLRWDDYAKDSFLGVVWRWSYYGNEIMSVVAFCPKCDTQLICEESFAEVQMTGACDHCKEVVFDNAEGIEGTISYVKRQIQRKLRNGQWESVVKEQTKALQPPSA